MKKIVLLLITLVITLSTTHAQVLKKSRSIKAEKITAVNGKNLLNPQPLPPKQAKISTVQRGINSHPTQTKPLPSNTNHHVKAHPDGSPVMLNPQPLPPKAKHSLKSAPHTKTKLLLH